MRVSFVLASALGLLPYALAQVPEWGQCGGINWQGPTICKTGYTCVTLNQHYSQCLATSSTLTSTSTSTTSAPAITDTFTPTPVTTTSKATGITCVPTPPWAALKPRTTGPPIRALDGWAAGSYLQKAAGSDAAILGPASSRGWFLTATSIRLIYSCPSFLYLNIHEASTSYKPLAFEATGTTFTWTFSAPNGTIGTTSGASTFVTCSGGALYLQTGADMPAGNCTTTRLTLLQA